MLSMWRQSFASAGQCARAAFSKLWSFLQELLYLYGVACLISAVCSLIHHATGLDRPVVLWGCAEVAFFLYSRWRYRQLHVDIPRFPVAENYEEQFQYFLSSAGALCIRQFFTGWFLNVPFEDIKRDNVKDFVSYAFLYKLRRELNSKERALLNNYVKRIEEVFGVRFEKGYNIGLKYMAHVFEPLRVIHKPLIWHAFAESAALLSHFLLLFWRFNVYYTPEFTFWVRDTSSMPLQHSGASPSVAGPPSGVLKQLQQAWGVLKTHVSNFLDAVFPPADTPWLQGPRLLVPIDVAAWLQHGPRLMAQVNAAAWLQQQGPRLLAPINVAAWLQQQAPLLESINVGAWLQQQGPLMAAPMQAAAWLQQQRPRLGPLNATAWLQQLHAGVCNLLDVDYDYEDDSSDADGDEYADELPPLDSDQGDQDRDIAVKQRQQSQQPSGCSALKQKDRVGVCEGSCNRLADASICCPSQGGSSSHTASADQLDALSSCSFEAASSSKLRCENAGCSSSCGAVCSDAPAMPKSKSSASLLGLWPCWNSGASGTSNAAQVRLGRPHGSLPNIAQLQEAAAASAATVDAGAGPVPIVFLHGVGFGMLPYLAFVRYLLHKCPSRPFICLEMRHVSLRLCKTAAEFDQVAASVVATLQAHGHRHACFVGHSFGTFVISRILQLYPEAVHSVCLTDPVAMLLCFPKTLHNFIYKVPSLWGLLHEPVRTVVDCVRWLCARDMLVAETFCRRFWWQSLVIWPQQLPDKAMVVLSGQDSLVASEEIRNLLVKLDSPARVLFNPNEFHGSFLIKPRLLFSIADQVHSMLAE